MYTVLSVYTYAFDETEIYWSEHKALLFHSIESYFENE